MPSNDVIVVVSRRIQSDVSNNEVSMYITISVMFCTCNVFMTCVKMYLTACRHSDICTTALEGIIVICWWYFCHAWIGRHGKYC